MSTPSVETLLYLDTLDLQEDFDLYIQTFLGDYNFIPNIFKYAHYTYLMGVCTDTGEVIENIDMEDPFEKKKREKMMRGQAINTSYNLMDTITTLCMGDNAQTFNVAKGMNLIEIKNFSESQSKIMKKHSKNKGGTSTNVEDIPMKKMS